VDALGYTGVALLVAIENLFPPIPSEIVLSLAGFYASRGDATVLGMIGAATAGSLVGAWILFGLAVWFGQDRLRALIARYGRWLRLTETDLDRADAWFDRHANMAVLICRCVPLVRSVISLPAGFSGMRFAPFTLYTLIGSVVWNSIFVVAGYQLGENWETVAEYADYLQYAVILAILAAVGFFVWRRWFAPSARERAARG
jgi:membrane protein DedA with SNARE-associated domain